MSEAWDFRFSGVRRAYGQVSTKNLLSAHAMVIGLGGVGSWAAEALVRTGIGRITLVDYDDICLSNCNRQIQATTNSVGKMKTSVLRDRFLSINPELEVIELQEMFSSDTGNHILRSADNDSVILDCMDSLSAKCYLIDHCYKNKKRLVVVGGSAGKTSPEMIQVGDLAKTHGDRLLHKVRKQLRQKYGFPRDLKKNWQIPAVFSHEPPVYPLPDGSVSREIEARPRRPLDCSEGMGSLCFLTGSFGFFAASEGVKILTTSR